MSSLSRLSRSDALVLFVDLQEKLLPAMHVRQQCVAAASKLARAARELGVPAIVTEQYPIGLGPTCAEMREMLADANTFQKLLFSACTPEVMQAIAQTGRRQIIVCGIEAHVCVQQSVLDLLRAAQSVWVCADAVSSRQPTDRDFALERLRFAGAIITTVESVIFELLGQAGTDEFKRILRIVK